MFKNLFQATRRGTELYACVTNHGIPATAPITMTMASPSSSSTSTPMYRQGKDRFQTPSQSPSGPQIDADQYKEKASGIPILQSIASSIQAFYEIRRKEIVSLLEIEAFVVELFGKLKAISPSMSDFNAGWIYGVHLLAVQQAKAKKCESIGMLANHRALALRFWHYAMMTDAIYEANLDDFYHKLHPVKDLVVPESPFNRATWKHEVLESHWESCGEKVAYMILRDPQEKSIVVLFRGTSTIYDILTDLGIETAPFCGSYAQRKMVEIAENMLKVLQPTLVQLGQRYSGYSLVFTGHSLGGALAALALVLCDKRHAIGSSYNLSLQAYGFGVPACMSPDLGQEYASCIHNLILQDDVVSRTTLANFLEFVERIHALSLEYKKNNNNKEFDIYSLVNLSTLYNLAMQNVSFMQYLKTLTGTPPSSKANGTALEKEKQDVLINNQHQHQQQQRQEEKSSSKFSLSRLRDFFRKEDIEAIVKQEKTVSEMLNRADGNRPPFVSAKSNGGGKQYAHTNPSIYAASEASYLTTFITTCYDLISSKPKLKPSHEPQTRTPSKESSAGLIFTAPLPLEVPGTLYHLSRHKRRKNNGRASFINNSRFHGCCAEEVMQPQQSLSAGQSSDRIFYQLNTRGHAYFKDILVSPTMFQDHRISNYIAALQHLIK